LDTWIQTQQLPSLTNFHTDQYYAMRTIRMNPRLPWILAVGMGKQDVWEEVRSYIATTSTSTQSNTNDHDTRKYYFGVVDHTWTSLLQPYDLPTTIRHYDDEGTATTTFFMIWQGWYWHDATYTTLYNFVDALESHRMTPQRPRQVVTGERGLHWTAELFLDFYPISLGLVLMILATIVVLCTNDPSTTGTLPQQQQKPKTA
jgi:hypothetical protein